MDNCDVTVTHLRANHNQLLRTAASNNHDSFVAHLHGCGLTTKDARARSNEALRVAVQMGFVRVMECLHRVYGLTTQDARGRKKKNIPLREALKRGHLAVVRCLVDTYGITPKEVEMVANQVFSSTLAFKAKHPRLFQYVSRVYALSLDKHDALCEFVECNDVFLLRVLHQEHKYTPADFKFNRDELLNVSLREIDTIPIFKWLHETFSFSDEDAVVLFDMHIKKDHRDVARWLLKHL